MRWVGKVTVMLLLYLSALLYTSSESLVRNEDSNTTSKLLSGNIEEAICSTKAECNDRGTCEDEEGKKVCKCQPEFDGNNCEIIKDCVGTGKYSKCKESGGTCEIVGDSPAATCTCTGDKTLDPLLNICRKCKCGPNERCSFEEGVITCNCKQDFKKDGEICKECKCTGKNEICSFDGGVKTCNCIQDYVKDGEVCKECKCTGKNEICSFDGGVKTCNCIQDYVKDGEVCKECKCGPNERCSFEAGVKTCNCKQDFKKDGELCKECKCTGENEICRFDGGVKKCNCIQDYIKDGEVCKECKCGANERCSFEAGVKTCNCKLGFIKFGEICKECNCGSKGVCSFKGDQKKCICDPGYIEKDGKCKDDGSTDACEKNPCQNEGTCESDDKMGYKCDCKTGLSGKNCEIIDWCKTNKIICGSTGCVYDKNTGSGFCSCKEGYYFDFKSKTCKVLDSCVLHRIKGTCNGDYQICDKLGECKCKENYFYNESSTACEPDFCGKKSKKDPCRNNMDCKEEENDETFSCTCKEGFRQFGKTCVKVNKCAPGVSSCQQKCNNGQCSCFGGFEKSGDGYSCERKETTSLCDENCGPGICVLEGTTKKCVCPEISHISQGKTCIDRCAAGKMPDGECPSTVKCISKGESGYTCNCTGKYDFDDDEIHCKAKDMCGEGGGNEDCDEKGGFCENDFDKPDGYICHCKFGYEKDPDTYKCRHKCEAKKCTEMQALCIITVENKPECICPPLLIKDTTGKCSQLAKYSFIGDFSVPKSKYEVPTPENSGRMKRDTFKGINYAKLLKDFEESMKNIFTGYKGTSVLNCTDEGDDKKCFVEMKLGDDPKGKLNIVSTPSVCLPLPDNLHCLIPPGFETTRRTIDDAQVFKKTNPCDKGVTGKLCGSDTECNASTAGFECKCREGYFKRNSYVPAPNTLIEICEDVNECLNLTICPKNTTCSNLQGDYTCNCLDGHRLEEGKSIKIDGCIAVCDPNPCVHGECFVTGKDGFSCRCDGLHIGLLCNEKNGAISAIKKSGHQNSAIIGGVLGAFLVVSIIISIILFRKFRNQKSIDDTEEYVRQRKRGLVSEMRKLGRRQPENDDVELRDHERRPNRETEDQKYNAQYRQNPIESMSIPRPQLGRSTDKGFNGAQDMKERRESGDYRKGYAGDDRMFPKAHSSRNSGEEYHRSSPRDDRQEPPRRPLSRSYDQLDNEKTGVSRMQYRNRGYEED